MNNPPATILIVDDNATNLKVLSEYLASQDYSVLIAEDGEAALEQTQYIMPDLILLDVMMPGIDGFETCRRLKLDPRTKNIPVIFLTAITDTQNVIKAFEVGAVDYIGKPLQQEEVTARVKSHISIRRLQRALQAEIAVREAAEGDLRRKEEELRETNAGKDQFFSVLANDLKGHMWDLLGLCDVMMVSLPETGEDNLKEVAGDVREKSAQIGEVLLSLLTWSQMQIGKLKPEPEIVSLVKDVEFVIKLHAYSAKKKKIDIINEVRKPEQLFCDVRMNDTVLRNLFNNAIKFSPFGSLIWVSAKKLENEMQITIKDSGKGIPEDQIASMFVLGKKKPEFGTSGEKGTGLGLPLCKEMVEKNGGKIWVESQPGQGTSVHFTVPLAQRAEDASSPSIT